MARIVQSTNQGCASCESTMTEDCDGSIKAATLRTAIMTGDLGRDLMDAGAMVKKWSLARGSIPSSLKHACPLVGDTEAPPLSPLLVGASG